EALRLEIEALRKEMRAMRERMRTLETKVEGQEKESVGRKEAATKAQRDQQYLYLRERAAAGEKLAKERAEAAARAEAKARAAQEQRAKEAADPVARIEKARRDQLTADLTSYAEGLLKKLHDNPNDKQAAEALEQALKRLRELSKSNQAKQPENPRASPRGR